MLRILRVITATLSLAFVLTSQPATAQESRSCARDLAAFDGAVRIPAGRYAMGSDEGYPEEGPAREAEVASFEIDRHEVTNAEFAAFVDATGYVTVAERAPDPADYPGVDASELVPGSAVFQQTNVRGDDGWRFVPGASWRSPGGPGSSLEGLGEHPVVHVAYEDAEAYARWKGRRLPSEAEWEAAARAGGETPPDWGREVAPAERWRANVWQGIFPVVDTGQDGFLGTAPVACYPADEQGAFDMIGNAWEWTSDRYDGEERLGVVKGGSFLCSEDFCARYRAAARQPLERGFSASHVGFRTVAD